MKKINITTFTVNVFYLEDCHVVQADPFCIGMRLKTKQSFDFKMPISANTYFSSDCSGIRT